jgi:tetratricopeptide (TPR) repeat protein
MEMDRYKPGLSKNQGLVNQLREFQRNPRSLVFVQLAESYRQEGLPQQALEILDEGLAHHSGLASAIVAKARCLFDMKKFADALTETQTAIRNNPQNLKAHKLQAEIYLRLGQRRAAIRSLTQVVSLYPQDVEAVRALEELENLETKQNVPPEKISRGSSDAPPVLGRIEDFQVGSISESIASLKDIEMAPKVASAIEASAVPELLKPATPSHSELLGAALAAAHLDINISVLDEDHAEPAIATRTIAELYLRQGLKPKAGGVLRKMLSVDPANAWARETLQDLESDGIVLPTQPPAAPKRSESLEKKARALEKLLARVRLMKPMGA